MTTTTLEEWRDRITAHATARQNPTPVDELDPTALTHAAQARRAARRAEAETWTDAYEAGIPHPTIADWAGEHPHSVRTAIEARRLARLPHEYETARGTRLTRQQMRLLGGLHAYLSRLPGFDLANAAPLARWVIDPAYGHLDQARRGRGIVFTADGQIFTTLTHCRRPIADGYYSDHHFEGLIDHSADSCTIEATRVTGLPATWVTLHELDQAVRRVAYLAAEPRELHALAGSATVPVSHGIPPLHIAEELGI